MVSFIALLLSIANPILRSNWSNSTSLFAFNKNHFIDDPCIIFTRLSLNIVTCSIIKGCIRLPSLLKNVSICISLTFCWLTCYIWGIKKISQPLLFNYFILQFFLHLLIIQLECMLLCISSLHSTSPRAQFEVCIFKLHLSSTFIITHIHVHKKCMGAHRKTPVKLI